MGNGYNPPVEESKIKGFFDASQQPNGSPDYTTTLLSTGDYMIVNTAGTLTISGQSTELHIGDYISKTQTGYQVINPTNPSFPGLPDGTLVKVINNQLTPAGIKEESERLYSEKSIQSEANSLYIGPACKLSEEGGLPVIESFVTLAHYMPVAKKVEDGDINVTDKPFYFEYTNNRDITPYPADTITTTYNHIDYVTDVTNPTRIKKIDIDFASDYNDVAFAVEMIGVTGTPEVRYIPSRAAWIRDIEGDNYLAGKRTVFDTMDQNRNDSPMVIPPGELIRIHVRSGGNYHLDLKGNDINPYLKLNINDAVINEMEKPGYTDACLVDSNFNEVRSVETIDQLEGVSLILLVNSINAKWLGDTTILAVRGGVSEAIQTYTNLAEGPNAIAITFTEADINALRSGSGDIQLKLVANAVAYTGTCLQIKPKFETKTLNADTQIVSAEDYNELPSKNGYEKIEDLNGNVIKFMDSGNATVYTFEESNVPINLYAVVSGNVSFAVTTYWTSVGNTNPGNNKLINIYSIGTELYFTEVGNV